MALATSQMSGHTLQTTGVSVEAMTRRATRILSTKVIEVQAVGMRADAPGILYLSLDPGVSPWCADALRNHESVVVMLLHVDEQGRSRLSADCPESAVVSDCVVAIITDLALIAVSSQGLEVREVAPGISAKEIQAVTELPLFAGPELGEFVAEPVPANEEVSLHA